MYTIHYRCLLIINCTYLTLFVFLSCGNPDYKNDLRDSDTNQIFKSVIAVSKTDSIISKNSLNNIASSKINSYVYVISKNGTTARSNPYVTEGDGIFYRFGEILEIVCDSGDWWGVIRLHWVPRTTIYVKKKDTGTELDIPLDFDALNEKYDERVNYDMDYAGTYENIEVIPITKDKYDKMKKGNIDNYYKFDTASIKKFNGLEKHKSSNGYESDYGGEFDFLNGYLKYWCWNEAEECGYDLIDKQSGTLKGSFPEFPHVSKDRKFIIAVHANTYRNFAYLTCHEIQKDTIISYARREFKNWMPVSSENEGVWGNDNCFYIPILPSVAYWPSYGNPIPGQKYPSDYNFRYIKIKVKGPSEAVD